MLDYPDQVKTFLQENFSPSDDNRAKLKWSTGELMGFLFNVFPRNCISDYDLIEILSDLGYKRYTWTEDIISQVDKNEDKEEYFTIKKRLVTGWCLWTELSLKDEEIKGSDKKK